MAKKKTKLNKQSKAKSWKTNLMKAKIQNKLKPSKVMQLRVKNGISQSQLAKKIGFKKSLQSFCRLENKKYSANEIEAAKIAKALNSSVRSLFKKVNGNYVAI